MVYITLRSQYFTKWIFVSEVLKSLVLCEALRYYHENNRVSDKLLKESLLQTFLN